MEATIFNYLDSILCSKKYITDINHEESQYSSFMCNRWISMYSNTTAEIINESTNKYWSQMMQPKDHYDFLMCLMPKYSRKKINYIKKVKEDPAAEATNNNAAIARKIEISTREVEQYMQLT
jgi:hypothetical protein